MHVFEAAVNRRSIRIFKNNPIDFNILERCVDAARLAPSAMNSQLCEYVIVDDAQTRSEILDSIAYWGGVPKPAEGWTAGKKPLAYIVVLINLDREKEYGCGRSNAFIDIGLALGNMTLVAWEEGIGTCVMTGIDKERIGKIVNATDRYEAAVLLSLGYPDEEVVLEKSDGSIKRWVDEEGVRHVPKRKLEDVIHRNRIEY
ncbi:MAG: nitroreductase family protein [Dehalococcoidales bacterium]